MRKNKWSIKWQLFGYLTLLVGGLLILLWLLQVVFMEDIYKGIEKKEVIAVGRKISDCFYDPDAQEYIEALAKAKNATVIVTNMYGQPYYISEEAERRGFSTIDSVRYFWLAKVAKENGGEILYLGDVLSKEFEQEESFLQDPRMNSSLKEDIITYTKIMSQNGEYVLFVIGKVAPVEATVGTIRKELLYVTIIMLVMTFALALYIAKKVATPIIEMNDKAKTLAANYNEEIAFDGRGYREISELASTLSFASRELARTENLRRELIANVSHDLRTPLTLICGYAEMMRDLPGENSPENSQVIIDEAKRLTALVNDMLDLSKLQAGTQQLDLKNYNLTANIEEIMKRYALLTEQEGYEITFSYDEEVYIEADELKISQVIYNLINNAINYTGSDKRVAVNQKMVNNNKVRVEVTDTGEGIAEENLPYIWDRYYKVDKTHKRATIGTGLGLSIVQNILKAHHAEYGVTSELGRGSTFWFEFNCQIKKEK